MEASGDRARRVEIGFHGGGALSLRLQEDAYRGLRAALGGGGESRWHEVESDDSTVTIDLSQVTFVRLDIESGRVGF